MADPSLFDFMRLPSDALIALDNRPLHFAMQPWHYLLRMVHVVCMGAFFGGILVLDLKLMGWHRAAPPRLFAEAILPWLYWVFGALVVTGGLLFAYDPVHVGSHAYFTPKLALTALGLGNALLFHRTGYLAPAGATGRATAGTRIAGAVSLAIWTAVVVCGCLNAEGVPKVFLR